MTSTERQEGDTGAGPRIARTAGGYGVLRGGPNDRPKPTVVRAGGDGGPVTRWRVRRRTWSANSEFGWPAGATWAVYAPGGVFWAQTGNHAEAVAWAHRWATAELSTRCDQLQEPTC